MYILTSSFNSYINLMPKTLLTIAFTCSVFLCIAQVKIGSGESTSVNPSAVLELSNNLSTSPSNWKTFLPPQVNFADSVFTSSTVWGVSGSPVTGAVVFNIGNAYKNGFNGPGLYCWMGNRWSSLLGSGIEEDKLRRALSTSVLAYDTAVANSWVMVTETEYNNLLQVVNGAGKYAANDSFMSLPSQMAWNQLYTVGGNASVSQLPPSSYIIAWSVRTGDYFNSTSQFCKIKVSSSQLTGYTDYGLSMPDYPVTADTRYYFIMKKPANPTGDLPSYTAVYTHHAKFLGGRFVTPGRDYFTPGNSPTLNNSNNSQSAVQFICTQAKQW